MSFEPIAIVGRGCVLPDALTPDEFCANIAAGRNSLSTVPEDRWGVRPSAVLGTVDDPIDRTWSAAGGYVRGFDAVFDPHGFAVDAREIAGLDPLFRWTLHTVREALREAGQHGPAPRAGLVMGNLSFPSAGLARYAESVWRGADRRPDPRNRFSSGLPAHFAARALGLGAGAFALDAACASSLYAIKLACDRLHDRGADLMIAGAVNCPDDLFIHVGFSALSALSRTGRSRPFHRAADGLVPAEGAGFVAMMRLSDAVRSGARVFGVIRGIGLSNDGRSGGLLVPAEEGQERAMRLAYQAAGVAPETVSLVECHATGTLVGDAAEARSMARVFRDSADLPVGSAKSNVGHLITTAGVAGLFKVLGAMDAGVLPPTLGADEPIDALAGTPLRLVREAEEWTGGRRAAVSAFGFGGNNAHLIVDAWDSAPGAGKPGGWTGEPAGGQPEDERPSMAAAATLLGAQRQDATISIIAVAARVANGRDTHDFCRTLFGAKPSRDAARTLDVGLDGLRFPPRDLDHTLAQQLLVLEAAREAVSGVNLPRERTCVLVGMGCDPEVARYGARWRVASWLDDAGADTESAQLARFRDAYVPALTSAGVVGTMPNVVANRINAQLDLAGPSFSVSAEEASGTVALELGARALRAGEADAVVVGAVDLSHEPVHQAALAELGIDRAPGDAAVVLVLKRAADARRDGDPVIALLDDDSESLRPADFVVSDDVTTAKFGSAHAASGLLGVALAALAVRHRAVPRPAAPADPALGEMTAEVVVSPLQAPTSQVRLSSGTPMPWVADAPPRLHVYSGTDIPATLEALAKGHESNIGPARLVILAASPEQFTARADAAKDWLLGQRPQPQGVAFRTAPLDGQVAFVFSGGSMAYAGMGRELLLAFPDQLASIEARSGSLRDIAGWAYCGYDPGQRHVLEQIWGSSLLGQLHAEITRNLLRISPRAVLGYSSGESNALSAMGLWTDAQALVADARASGLFTRGLVGEFEVMREAWRRAGVLGDQWESYMVSAPADDVRVALAGEPAVHMVAVNSPDSCIVGGEAGGCQRVLGRLGSAPAMLIPYEVAVHVPELEDVREEWWQLHHRPVTPLPGVRFYTCSSEKPYEPTAATAADALTGMALGTVDFVRMVERAWADGARVFIEHGPKGLCTGWIKRILGDRDHLAVALDASDGRDVRQLLRAVADLTAAGVAVDSDALIAHLEAAHPGRSNGQRSLSFPAHPPAVQLPELETPELETPELETPELETPELTMPRAPWLPPIAEEQAARSAIAPAPAVGPAPTPVAAPRPSLAALAAQQNRIAALHQEFLVRHAQLHQQFLRTRQQAEALLLAARPAVTSIAPTASPEPVVVQPAQPTPPEPVIVQPAQPVVVVEPVVVEPARPALLPGPKFDRKQLEWLASDRISTLFGPQFAAQDDYVLQTRMPQPPMLLADRVTGIDAVPGSMGTGTIWTETDVELDSWYLDHTGRMPAGVMIEAGQADLLLISWLGVDLLNRGERVYRLLGCELTYHGSPPTPGETLSYEIHIDGHGEHDGVRLFFFHYNCYVGDELRLSVRGGQAGFFTDAELAVTRGVLWDPEDELPEAAPVAPPDIVAVHRSFDHAAVLAFADGRPYDCFGPGWERTQAHVRSPRIGDERMLFLHEVAEFAPDGGPWGRGYLRAETPISPDDWFFEGHFKNDPCMPGTLMFEGCLQAMAFHLAGLGYTAERDGWRFEPVPGQTYPMRCRGQVTPESRQLTYEVFVTEVSAGPEPTLFADVLCTVDGVKAFHARRVGLRLVPDWPMSHWRHLAAPAEQRTGELVPVHTLGGLRGHVEPKPVAEVDGFRFDYASLLACAWGRPSEAFGPMYSPFDGTRKVARLPGPPYHFMSRIAAVSGPQGGMQTGSWVEVEYDVPDDVWYREQNAYPAMPLGVLMEVVLQPCGWLASYVGSALTTDIDLLFRNLDGDGVVMAEILPGTRVLRTRAELTKIAQTAGMIIESFEVECFADDRPAFTLSTVFGYFPKEAFDNQVGLPPSDEERARLAEPCALSVDLTTQPDRYCAGSLRLAGPMLLMLDRVTGYWPDGGRAGLGRLRSEKDVDPSEWFFKAHFFQDPVQPGSLGIEAMAQLLQFYMIERDMGAGLPRPRFEPVMIDHQIHWKYRGQVVPRNKLITVEMEILEVGADDHGRYAVAEAWLWADDKRIYHAPKLAMRVVPGDDDGEDAIDPAVDTWVTDHRPTWTVPALPMMSVADRLAGAAAADSGQPPVALRDVQVHRWIQAQQQVRLSYQVTGTGVERAATLFAWRDAANPALSRFEPVATATVLVGAPASDRPAALAPLPDALPVADPYESGTLFHGPSFQYLLSLRIGATGASGVLDAGRGGVPRGALHQGLLDAATHAIPHDQLYLWSAEIDPGMVGYPHRISSLDLYEPLPDTGEIRVEARFAGFDGDDRSRPAFDVQLLRDGRVLASMHLVEVLLPKGPLGSAPPADRRAFLRDRHYAGGIGLSTSDDGVTWLTAEAVDQSDWLPGTVAAAYGLPAGARGRDRLAEIAVRDHLARQLRLHPSLIEVSADLRTAHPITHPLEPHAVLVEQDGDRVVVRSL